MRTEEFEQWLGNIPDLTLAQRQQAVESLTQTSPLGEAIAAMADPHRRCPHCDHAPCGHGGQAHGLPR